MLYICKYESKAMAQCIEVLYFFRLRFLWIFLTVGALEIVRIDDVRENFLFEVTFSPRWCCN